MTEKLPEWLSSILPEPETPILLRFEDSKYYAVYPDGHTDTFSDVKAAYESANSSKIGVKFDNSIPELRRKDGKTVRTSEGETLFALNSETRKWMLENSYSGWLNGSAKRYADGNKNFLDSYNFLDGHPCFWTRRDDLAFVQEYPYEWKTNQHVKRFWFEVDRSETRPGGVVFMMECGSHIAPNYTHHGHDFRFDVWEDSFENAVIKTAELIHKFFNTDGSERENVDYEKTELELTLESRMNAVNEAIENGTLLSNDSTSDSDESIKF